MTAACLALPLIHRFELVAATQALAACAGAIFPPAIAAVTLGTVGPRAFTRRIGRNEAFNHAGNATAAAIAAVTAYFYGPIVVFWLLAAMAVASVFATLSIPADAIRSPRPPPDAASGGRAGHRGEPVRIPGAAVLQAAVDLRGRDGPVSLFERGDAAARRPEVALVNRDLGTTLMSACIIARNWSRCRSPCWSGAS